MRSKLLLWRHLLDFSPLGHKQKPEDYPILLPVRERQLRQEDLIVKSNRLRE